MVVLNIFVYLLIINLITFFIMYIDKRRAKKGKWRVKESTLITLALIRWRNRWNAWNEDF